MSGFHVNVYTERICRVWFVLDEDFCAVPLGSTVSAEQNPDCGSEPDWLTYEAGEIGWDGVAQVPRTMDDGVAFGLAHGIAYWQPFLVEIRKPAYTRDYWGDWDVDYDASVIAVDPLPLVEAASRWEEWLGRGMQEAASL